MVSPLNSVEKSTESENICDSAPYPKCNGAEGCQDCEHQKDE